MIEIQPMLQTCALCKTKFYCRPGGPRAMSNPELEACSEECALEIDEVNLLSDVETQLKEG